MRGRGRKQKRILRLGCLPVYTRQPLRWSGTVSQTAGLDSMTDGGALTAKEHRLRTCATPVSYNQLWEVAGRGRL